MAWEKVGQPEKLKGTARATPASCPSAESIQKGPLEKDRHAKLARSEKCGGVSLWGRR